MNDMKMSKSLGNAMDPIQLIDDIGNDQMRYFLLSEMHFGSDSRFTEEALIGRINQDLANRLGNLVQRTVSLIKKISPDILKLESTGHASEEELNVKVASFEKQFHKAFQEFKFHLGIQYIMEFIDLMNLLFEQYKPWALAKEKPDELQPFLFTILKGISLSFCYLTPVLPDSSKKYFTHVSIYHKNNFPQSLSEIRIEHLLLDEWTALFPRMEKQAAS
jgi:methionyl-tRNA synthetase